MRRCLPCIFMFLVALFFAHQAYGAVWYVDSGKPHGGTGTSWAQAFDTIQEGIDAASAGHEIWVKISTYLPASEIAVYRAVSIYGGFNGTETSRTQRNFISNVTSIDGNNAHRCLNVTVSGAVIDGFTITQGTITGRGAGMINNVSGTSPNTTVQNCIFDQNVASESAGAIYDLQGHMNISGCTFQYNQGIAQRAGALYVYYTSSSSFGSVSISNCNFIQNTGGNGGAIFIKGGAGAGPNSIGTSTFQQNGANDPANGDGGAIICDPTTSITGCSFLGNSAGRYGTIASYVDTGNIITITNCIFAGNQVQHGGGICINGSSNYVGTMIVTNCTFSGNVASGGGGAIYSLKATDASSVFTVTNSILWNDSDNEIAVGGSGGLPTVRYSDVDQDGYAGSNGNIRETPLFVSASDLHLTDTSPCIDVGTNSAPSIPLQDIDGEDRTMDGDENGSSIADMGADEFNPGSAPPGWTAATVPPAGDPGVRIRLSATVNALAMMLLPFAAIVAAAAFRRRR